MLQTSIQQILPCKNFKQQKQNRTLVSDLSFLPLVFLYYACLLNTEPEYSRSNLVLKQLRCAMTLFLEYSIGLEGEKSYPDWRHVPVGLIYWQGRHKGPKSYNDRQYVTIGLIYGRVIGGTGGIPLSRLCPSPSRSCPSPKNFQKTIACCS